MFYDGQRAYFEYGHGERWRLTGTVLGKGYSENCYYFLADEEFEMPSTWTRCPSNKKAFETLSHYLKPLPEEDTSITGLDDLL